MVQRQKPAEVFEVPTIWTVYHLEQGPLYRSGVSTEWSSVVQRTEISPQLGEEFL